MTAALAEMDKHEIFSRRVHIDSQNCIVKQAMLFYKVKPHLYYSVDVDE